MSGALLGAAAYEFRMQIRRWSLWLMMLAFASGLFALTATSETWKTYSHERAALVGFADVASLVMLLLPVAVGLLLADRLARDRATRVEETLDTLPASYAARLIGKYLGATTATLIPVLMAYLAGALYLLALHGRDVASLPGVALPFLAVIVPGCLFVAAFSVACPAIMPAPLYQVLFVGYWFWGNLLQISAIPTLNGTLLTPAGDYMLAGFFGSDGNVIHHASVTQAIASVAVLLGAAALALAGAWLLKRWQLAQA